MEIINVLYTPPETMKEVNQKPSQSLAAEVHVSNPDLRPNLYFICTLFKRIDVDIYWKLLELRNRMNQVYERNKTRVRDAQTTSVGIYHRHIVDQ